MKDKKWKIMFSVLLVIWLTVVLNTVYYWYTGDEILIDTDVNLYYLTLPPLIIIIIYTAVTSFILITYLAMDKKVRSLQNKTYEDFREAIMKKNVLCSIVIAAHNEDTVIRKTVTELLKQTYQNIEIIVVCHNCSDNTFAEASFKDPRVMPLDYKTKDSGKGIALNFGVSKSQGEYILVLDADGILSHDFVEKGLPLLEKYAAVQGRYVPSNRNYSFVTRLLSIEGDLWSTPYMTARTALDQRGGLGGTGYILRKDILQEVGGFTNHLVDDYELTSRLLRKGYRIVFAPDCINYDEKPPTIEILLKQRARWAKGFIDLLKHRVCEPTDILGIIFWASPIVILTALALFLTIGFGMIFNLVFGYFPFNYAAITINQWLLLTAFIWLVQITVLAKEYGWNGLKYAILVPIYNSFVLYVFVVFVRAWTIKSWGATKTTHGFTAK
ncbi:MAG TPA: glycosyltransferase family 2 protein [Candidatus Nitrosocosmicus sp.]|nr:glycosyltransferase family 2 protein [Candidatus Nitrosocosmicus sp.]